MTEPSIPTREQLKKLCIAKYNLDSDIKHGYVSVPSSTFDEYARELADGLIRAAEERERLVSESKICANCGFPKSLHVYTGHSVEEYQHRGDCPGKSTEWKTSSALPLIEQVEFWKSKLETIEKALLHRAFKAESERDSLHSQLAEKVSQLFKAGAENVQLRAECDAIAEGNKLAAREWLHVDSALRDTIAERDALMHERDTLQQEVQILAKRASMDELGEVERLREKRQAIQEGIQHTETIDLKGLASCQEHEIAKLEREKAALKAQLDEARGLLAEALHHLNGAQNVTLRERAAAILEKP